MNAITKATKRMVIALWVQLLVITISIYTIVTHVSDWPAKWILGVCAIIFVSSLMLIPLAYKLMLLSGSEELRKQGIRKKQKTQ